VALLRHHAGRRLAGEEEAPHVDLERQVEVGLGDQLGRVGRAEAGVVDEDVEPAERGQRPGDGFVDLAGIAYVHRHGERLAPHRRDLLHQVVRCPRHPQAKHHVSAGVRHRERDLPTEATRGPGDKSDLPVEIEPGEHGHAVSKVL
jgi:hypothetical protein